MFALGIGLQGAQPLQPGSGLTDPLKTVTAISGLIDAGREAGFDFLQSSDFTELSRQRKMLRNSDVSPMFDPTTNRNLSERGFWMAARDKSGTIIGLQAFRLDEADPNLAEWVLGWMMGLYAKRREMIIPRGLQPPDHSLSHLVRGRVVYHGELWIDKHSKGCFNVFPRIGMLLALVKWQPEAIWALTGSAMATRGHMVRMGYGHLEQSFLTWDWEPEGADRSEWIGIAERRHLEFSVAEIMAAPVTEGKYPPSPVP
ncbi:MAG: hypothetical protein KDK89_22495 [Alphaproteobacteria bacterium]|nr:hypothetical protein [Alphaproteobacteria bacterium]